MADVKTAPQQLNYSDVLPLAIDSRAQRRYFYPNNGATFSPTGATAGGANVIRMDINADSMLDCAHSYLLFNLTAANGANTCGVDMGVPMFSRLRIESGGVVLEDIQEYGRLYAMLEQLQGAGFSALQEKTLSHATTSTFQGGGAVANVVETCPQLEINTALGATSTRQYAVPLISGLFNMDKYLPLVLMNAGVTIELHLAERNQLGTMSADVNNDWSLSSVKYVAQLIDLDRSFYDRLRMMMESSGGVLQLHGQTWRHFQSSIPANADTQTSTLNIPVRVKSIKSIFTRFTKTADENATQAYAVSVGHKQRIEQWQFKIGSVNYPASSVQVGTTGVNMGETYAELLKAFGKYGAIDHPSLALNATAWGNQNTSRSGAAADPVCSFTIGYDFESFQKSALESGINTADRALPVSLEVNVDNNNNAFGAHSFVLADALFYVNLDGSVSVSV